MQYATSFNALHFILAHMGAIPPEQGGTMGIPARAQQGDPQTADHSHLP